MCSRRPASRSSSTTSRAPRAISARRWSPVRRRTATPSCTRSRARSSQNRVMFKQLGFDPDKDLHDRLRHALRACCRSWCTSRCRPRSRTSSRSSTTPRAKKINWGSWALGLLVAHLRASASTRLYGLCDRGRDLQGRSADVAGHGRGLAAGGDGQPAGDERAAGQAATCGRSWRRRRVRYVKLPDVPTSMRAGLRRPGVHRARLAGARRAGGDAEGDRQADVRPLGRGGEFRARQEDDGKLRPHREAAEPRRGDGGLRVPEEDR